MWMASWPIHAAMKAQAIVASSTASGSEAPAKGIAGDRAVATAAAGAIAGIDWNNTSGKPIASFLSVKAPAPLIPVWVFPVVVSDMALSPLLLKFQLYEPLVTIH